MNILLTNDDGYQAGGLLFLKDYFLRKGHKVFIVAPDSEKSGSSHALTLKDSIRLVDQKENTWIICGTPADCVLLGLIGLVPEKIDVVLSGLNHGLNIGRDIIYSGTVGGARQGGFTGLPSFALSIDADGKALNFKTIENFLNKNFIKLVKLHNEKFFFNINFPNLPQDKIKGVKSTIPCHSHQYEDELVSFDSPFQGRYYWIHGDVANYEYTEGSDAKAINDECISVSPIKVYPEAVSINMELQ